MKRLIPAFLSGVFALTGLTGLEVLANNVVKTTEFSNTEVVHNDSWSVGLDVISVQIEGSEDTYKFIPIMDLLIHFGHKAEWNAETNTLEITESLLHYYMQGRELHPIIEPIDMDNINSDEWVDIWMFSSFSTQDTQFIVWRNEIIVSVDQSPEIPEDVDLDYWFESNYKEGYKTVITSVIGCDAQKVRSIRYVSENGFNDIKFNLQDLIDSGIFPEGHIEEVLERMQSTRRDYSSDWMPTEEEIANINLEMILFNATSEFFSGDKLEQLAELARDQMLNN